MAATFRRNAPSRYLPLALLYLPMACVGNVGDAPSSTPGAQPGQPGAPPNTPGGSTTPGGTSPPGVAPANCDRASVGVSPLRRLTHVEYDNAIADLLGDRSQPSKSFPEDGAVGLFKNSAAGQSVSALLAEGYLNSAAQLAQKVNVAQLLGCDVAAGNCVSNFIQAFGRRAFRRPLKPDEAQRLQQVFDGARTKANAETGARAVIAAVLAAPQFLYHVEVGAQDAGNPGVKKLAPFEVAARLGSLLWASLPDNELLDAAGSGRLSTKEQVAEQAQRMLKDPRARAATNVFYEQWFGMHELENASKDAQLYPMFTPELRQSMHEETVRFVNHVVWEGDGKLSTLLSAPYSFIDSRLAALYGVPAPAGQGFQQTNLKATERAGILTHASFLAGFSGALESSPFKRGAWVRTRVLCQELPVPPAEVPPLPEVKEGISTRQRAQQHTSDPSCASCHRLIDGLGFGLEQYDTVGKVRTMDRGQPVDTSGEVGETADINGKFNGGAELAKMLARSEQVRDCAPAQWMRYALARPQAAEDSCSIQQLRRSFAASGGNLKDLLLAVTQTDAFLHYRRPDGP